MTGLIQDNIKNNSAFLQSDWLVHPIPRCVGLLLTTIYNPIVLLACQTKFKSGRDADP